MDAAQAAEKLGDFLMNHPVSKRAARPLKRGAEVQVQIDGSDDPYRFLADRGSYCFEPGRAADPDFELYLSPAAVERVATLEGGDPGDFGIAFFKEIIRGEVRVRLHAGFLRLTRKGYLGVLATGGGKIIVWLASQGLRGPGAVKAAIDRLRAQSRG